jgi:hypothetical protein
MYTVPVPLLITSSLLYSGWLVIVGEVHTFAVAAAVALSAAPSSNSRLKANSRQCEGSTN